MKCIIKYCAIVFFSCAIIRAGENKEVKIKGQVLDDETGAPIENVDVFLDNTTIGTVTGRDGKYVISKIPFGSYKIIFSYIGYETEERDFFSYKNGTFEFNVSLRKKIINLNQVNVTGAIPEDWKDNLKTFTKVFLGKTENSEKTKIINPEVLNFVMDKNTDVLKAYSDSTVIVENKALGYVLYIVLDSLVYNPNKTIKYMLYPKFKELTPASEEEKLEWNENRRKTFLNSRKHFFYALVHNQLYKYYSILQGPINFLLMGYGTSFYPSDLNLACNEDSTIFVFNFSGGLEINDHSNPPSFLNFFYPSVSIDKYGNLMTSLYVVETSGYWATKRIADLLPKNYFYNGH